MKRYLRSSKMPTRFLSVNVIASTKKEYSNRYTRWIDGQQFVIYTENENDPDLLQCQVSEIHPYDLADYAWCKKDSPASATVYKHGKKLGYIDIPFDFDEYDDTLDDPTERFIDDVITYLCRKLREYNKKVEHRIDRT